MFNIFLLVKAPLEEFTSLVFIVVIYAGTSGITFLDRHNNDDERCVSSPHLIHQRYRCTYTPRFSAEGGWLLAGTGNSALTLYSLSLGALAKQQSVPMVPQV